MLNNLYYNYENMWADPHLRNDLCKSFQLDSTEKNVCVWASDEIENCINDPELKKFLKEKNNEINEIWKIITEYEFTEIEILSLVWTFVLNIANDTVDTVSKITINDIKNFLNIILTDWSQLNNLFNKKNKTKKEEELIWKKLVHLFSKLTVIIGWAKWLKIIGKNITFILTKMRSMKQ